MDTGEKAPLRCWIAVCKTRTMGLVIGTRGHELVVRALLRATRRRAETPVR